MQLRLVVPPGRGGIYDMATAFCGWLTQNDETVAASVMELSRQSALDFDVRDAHRDEVFILQFSHYGYQRRGVPIWLLHWASSVKRARAVVGVYFHELYATGPVWRSSYWLSPLQRNITNRLLQICDFWLTNRTSSAIWLSDRGGAPKPSLVSPVISNVGEAERLRSSRTSAVVVFGSAELRAKVYRDSMVLKWVRANSFSLHDIGPVIAGTEDQELRTVPGVIIHGRQDAASVSEVLREARFGIVCYPVPYLAKSGVFAAYAAHGVCPIVVSVSNDSNDGLLRNVNYINSGSIPPWIYQDYMSVGANAFTWYSKHNLRTQGAALLELVHRYSSL